MRKLRIVSPPTISAAPSTGRATHRAMKQAARACAWRFCAVHAAAVEPGLAVGQVSFGQRMEDFALLGGDVDGSVQTHVSRCSGISSLWISAQASGRRSHSPRRAVRRDILAPVRSTHRPTYTLSSHRESERLQVPGDGGVQSRVFGRRWSRFVIRPSPLPRCRR